MRQSPIKGLLPTWEYVLHLEACKCLQMDETSFVNLLARSISAHVLQIYDPRKADYTKHHRELHLKMGKEAGSISRES